MSFINNYLTSISETRGSELYAATGTVAHVVMVLVVLFYLCWMRPNFLTFLKGVVVAVLTYYFTGYAQYFMVWYRVGFSPDAYFQTANLALGFVLLPLLAWLAAKILNISVGYAGDVTALTMLGYHVIGRSGCIFGGCCYGFPCEWGWHNTATGIKHFPTAFIESLFTLAILVFILYRICRRSYTPDGKNLPYFLLLYGVCRFFSEMTRESTREYWIFWRFSDVHIHMLLMTAVGGALLWYAMKKDRSDEAGEELSLPVIRGR